MVKLQLIQSRLNFSQTNELQMYPPQKIGCFVIKLKFSKIFLHFFFPFWARLCKADLFPAEKDFLSLTLLEART